MKQSKLVTAPRKWKSAQNHPEAHLAYITKEEQNLLIKKDLYNSLKGKPNRGPGGIPSLQGDMGRTGSRAENQRQGPGHPGGGYDPNRNQPTTTYKTPPRNGDKKYDLGPPRTGGPTITTGDKIKKTASTIGWVTQPGLSAAIWAGKKIFGGPKVPPNQAGGASAKVIKMGGVKVKDTGARRYTNLRHDQEDPGGPKHGPEVAGPMTTTLVTTPTADVGHKWGFKAYDTQQATTTPNVYDYSKAPYAKKGKLVHKYQTGKEIKKSAGIQSSKAVAYIQRNGDTSPTTTKRLTRTVSSPTSTTKKAKSPHNWAFQAYPGMPGTTYDPTQYVKQGKLMRKYGTGQEVKTGKRFGPPPLRGPDPQGIQVILENSDYFKKLIG